MNNNLKNWKIMQLLNIYNQSHAWKKDIFKVLWFYVKNYESLICGKKSDILELLNNTMVLHQNHGFIWKIMQLLNIYNQSHVWKKTFSRSFDFTSTIMNVWFPIRPIFLMLISIYFLWSYVEIELHYRINKLAITCMQRLPFDSITKNVFFMGNMKSNTFQSGTVQRVGLGPNCGFQNFSNYIDRGVKDFRWGIQF